MANVSHRMYGLFNFVIMLDQKGFIRYVTTLLLKYMCNNEKVFDHLPRSSKLV